VLYVREGLDGKDRVLVDVNLLAADGTVALDWFWPAEHGKYVADVYKRQQSVTTRDRAQPMASTAVLP